MEIIIAVAVFVGIVVVDALVLRYGKDTREASGWTRPLWHHGIARKGL
jgi:hypothetical protein